MDGGRKGWMDGRGCNPSMRETRSAEERKGLIASIHRDLHKPCPSQITKGPQYSLEGPERAPKQDRESSVAEEETRKLLGTR